MKRILPIIIALLLPFVVMAQSRNGKENLIIKEWNVETSSGVKILDHLTIYNSLGLKVEEAEYGKDGVKWRKKFEYTPTGRKHKEFIYNAKGKMSRYKIYEYSTSSGN